MNRRGSDFPWDLGRTGVQRARARRSGRRVRLRLQLVVGDQHDRRAHVLLDVLPDALGEFDLAELCITSSGTARAQTPPEGAFMLPDAPGISVIVGLADGARCERCWRVLPEVGHIPRHDDLCQRCADVLDRGTVPLAAVAG